MIAAVQWLQVGFYAGMIGLIYLIARQLRPVAWAARLSVVFALLYLPLLLAIPRVMVELHVALALLLAVWFWLREKLVAGGLACFVALADSWFSFWPKAATVLLFGGAVWRCRPELRKPLQQGAMALLLPALLMFGIQHGVAYQLLPPSLLWVYADTEGWQPLVEANGMLSYLAVNGPQVLMLHMQGQAPLPEVFRWFLVDWPQALALTGANLFRLFALPDNFYHLSWLFLTPGWTQALHWLLVTAGFLSMGLALRDRRLWLLIWPVVVWGWYAVSHTEARYNLPVMPFVLLLAGIGVSEAFLFWRREPEQRPMLLRGMLAIGLLGALWHVDWYPLLLGFLPGVAPVTAQVMILVLSASLVAWLLWRISSGKRFALALAAFWLLLGLVHLSVASAPTGWRTPVNTIGVRKIITLPSSFFETPDMATFLVLDIEPWRANAGLRVTLDGRPIPITATVPAGLDELKVLGGSGLLPAQSLRQYTMQPLDPLTVRQLAGARQVEVRVALGKSNAQPVWLYGDYALDNHRRYRIPDPDWSRFAISRIDFQGDGRNGLPIKGPDAERRDLSPELGVQTGQYRIFLYRIPQSDAANPQFPFPGIQMSPEGHLVKNVQIAY